MVPAAHTIYSPVETGYWAKAILEARPSRRRGAVQPAVFIVVAVVAVKFLGGD